MGGFGVQDAPFDVQAIRDAGVHGKKLDCGSKVSSSGKDLLMQTFISQLVKDESGTTAIEYGLIAAGISIAIIATVNALGTQLNSTFSSISSQLK